MALLALSNVKFCKLKKELFLDEIKEIIKYHQKHRNLTRIAYKSAWLFLINRLYKDKSLETVIVNELHFGRSAARELKELTKCVNWKREKEEEDGRGERKEEVVLLGWLNSLEFFFRFCELRNGGYVELFSSIVEVLRASRDDFRGISNQCIYLFDKAAKNKAVQIDFLLKSGAIDIILEEIHRLRLNDEAAHECLQFFKNVSKRLKRKKKDEMKEVGKKPTKKELFEKLEEEGYEDVIVSFCEMFDLLRQKYFYAYSSNVSIYFVYI
ncbi:uncharacterized protein MONOS_10927 [Monocercomonoides exilis]|uniref:uncharacterized protein n=1 Tax=Monocercomonoides exilis TaxID=2049356 RepID=UPI00355A15AC|nr:hypothetical protein MONOS_10927 [Monocercomonoides exilis]|eukprot:MONOS_10927.1-p1 / transcript=MONOS_10927.1 / gene=MONOS_10927 / organism=Monocercomonoides_exilis_PA203 / gene_product=unspecified product / transcript_product=unspecified product / location=Mono_scaffold00519:34082-34942(-) / protein_length=268 / sequence_SO=supercontig / SO=protein_coding / is_pseudo=false